MSDNDPFYDYQATSYGFLERAMTHLQRFDEEHYAPSLFYAALELRLGIEARLWEYLRPALKSLGKQPKEIGKCAATKLLRRLTSLNPDAKYHTVFRITDEQSGDSTELHYTPVSQELAQLHGRLGEILHFNFFVNNEYWNLRSPLEGKGHKSLADYRELLRKIVSELETATSGTLLNNPRFTQLVSEVLEEPEERGQP